MSGLDIWLTALAMIAIGCACICLALILSAEIRKVAMSPELLGAALRGGPLLVVYGLVGGALLAGSGLLLAAFLAASDASHIWNALLQTFGWR